MVLSFGLVTTTVGMVVEGGGWYAVVGVPLLALFVWLANRVRKEFQHRSEAMAEAIKRFDAEQRAARKRSDQDRSG